MDNITEEKETTMPDTQSFTLGAAIFTRAVLNSALFTSTDVTLPSLTSVHLKSSDGNLRIEATDRYMLALEDLPCDGDVLDILVDAKDVVRVLKTLAIVVKPHIRYGNDESRITVAVAEGQSFATFTLTGYPGPDTALAVATVPGEFPRTDRLVPSPDSIVFTKAFADRHITRLAKVVTDQKAGDRIISLGMQDGVKPAIATWDGDDSSLRVVMMPTKQSRKD